MKTKTIKQVLLLIAFVATTVVIGLLFTSLRSNALSAKSFEANPTHNANIESLQDLDK